MLKYSSRSVKMPKKIAILYSDVKREYFYTEVQYLTEKDAEKEAAIIAQYLKKLHIESVLIPGDWNLTTRLKQEKPDMVLNLVCSVRGVEFLASAIPGTLELLNIPYTGAGILGESLTYNKFLVKKLLQQNGVPVPYYQLFNTAKDYLDSTLRFPLIAKLNEIHGGVEITRDAVSENEKHLRNRLAFLIKTYEQPALVEEFIVGKEISAFLFDGVNKKVYMAERVFHKKHGNFAFASFEDQWIAGEAKSFNYRKYPDPLLREYVRRAFSITAMNDYGKFDIRIDNSGRYYFLDVNTNPYFGPKELDVPMSIILDMFGVSFVTVLKRLLLNTMRDAAGLEPVPQTRTS